MINTVRETDTASNISKPSRSFLRVSLWIAQVVLAAFFGLTGVLKLTLPIPQLAAMLRWPAMYGEAFTRFLGVCELAGALGLLLPAATRIFPRLTLLAAACLVLLQICAVTYHVSQHEFVRLPLNIVLIATAAFILWGRWSKAPIPRR
jgi:Na+-translocating ferredoxin:NAD+ oxidoreductase RnfA subunit